MPRPVRSLTRGAATALAAGLLTASATPALAHPTGPIDATVPTDVTFAATDNIEYLGRFPEHAGTAGASILDDRLYLTDPRGVYVYDVTDPATPMRLGSLPLPQSGTMAALAQEDPDTDGEILLVDGIDVLGGSESAMLRVVDVSDPANLRVLGSAPVTDHTWTCVTRPDPALGAATPRSCDYAYGRTGHVVDLTDPTAPVNLDDTWRAAVDHGDRGNSPYTHDLTEIAPGLVMSAGATAILMDTTDPTRPVELARIEQFDRFSSLGYHSVEWANGGTDPIAVLGTEIAPGSGARSYGGSDCQGDNSVIETWDASSVAAAIAAYRAGAPLEDAFADARFTLLDAYDASERGIFLDGKAAAHVLYCAHWMELHPDFAGGGLMVASYYNRGTRFVDVAADGTMTEIGWITANESYSGSAQWVSDDVVYVMDYARGLEVIRLRTDDDGEVASATGTYSNDGVDLVAAGSSVSLVGDDGHAGAPAAALAALLGVTLAGLGVRRRSAVAG